MRKMILPAAFLVLSASMAFATVTKADVRKLLAAGISEDTIILFIHRNAPSVSPTPEDLGELKNAGASDKVLNALVEASMSTGSSYSSGSTTSPGYTTTTVYPSTSYYYDYYPYYYPYYYYPYLYTYPFLSFSFGFGFSNVHCDDHHHQDFHHQDFHHQDFHHDQVHTMPHPTASPQGGGASTFRGGGGHGGGGHGGGGHGGHR